MTVFTTESHLADTEEYDIARPRSTPTPLEETLHSRSSITTKQSSLSRDISTSQGQRKKLDEQSGLFHRLSAHHLPPEVRAATDSKEPQPSSAAPSALENRSGSASKDNNSANKIINRRKSTTVKNSFKRLFSRSSHSDVDEVLGARDKVDLNTSNNTIPSAGDRRRPTTSPVAFTSQINNTPHYAHARDEFFSPDSSSRRNRLQRVRHVKDTGDQDAFSRQPITAVSATDRASDNDTNISAGINPTTQHQPSLKSRRPSSRRHVKDSLETLRTKYQTDQNAEADNKSHIPDVGFKWSDDTDFQQQHRQIPAVPKQASLLNPESRQTAPRQVMEATSMAARIAELEKRLTEVEYSIHRISKALLDQSPNRRNAKIGDGDSEPYLTPPLSQHETVSADTPPTPRVSPSTSKKFRHRGNPMSPVRTSEDVEADQDTTPRATFLTAPSIDELRRAHAHHERTPRALHRTSSADDLNVETSTNILKSSTMALHNEISSLRSDLNSGSYASEPYVGHERFDNDATRFTTAPSFLPVANKTGSARSTYALNRRDPQSRTAQLRTSSNRFPASRFSAYETDDSVDELAFSAAGNSGTDADGEDNGNTAYSTQRSSIEAMRSSAVHHPFASSKHMTQNSRPPVPVLSSTSRPFTAGGALERASGGPGKGKMIPRAATGGSSADERKRNQDFLAFFGSGPPV